MNGKYLTINVYYTKTGETEMGLFWANHDPDDNNKLTTTTTDEQGY